MTKRFYRVQSSLIVADNAGFTEPDFVSNIPDYVDDDSTRFYWNVHPVTSSGLTILLTPFATVRGAWIWNLDPVTAGTVNYRTPSQPASDQFNNILPGQAISLGRLNVSGSNLLLDAAAGTIDMGVFLAGT